MNDVDVDMCRARRVARIGDLTFFGPWVEYGPQVTNGAWHALQESTELLFRDLRRRADFGSEVETRSSAGWTPS